MYRYYTVHLPIGPLLILSTDKGVTQLHLWAEDSEGMVDRFQMEHPGAHICEDHDANHTVIDELNQYFAGELKRFTVRLDLQGTAFQKSVWKALLQIPYGETRTYGEMASQLGKPGAARAVGMANRWNPVPIVVPCHRVIGADGSMTGYAGKSGIETKRFLLNLERRYSD